jgi:arylsulfatase A-like enzyme
MDDNVGKILKTLEEAGIADRTLIWFTSDNGGVQRFPGNNGPLREGKLTVYEGGVRVPAAVWWPGVIEGGRKVQARLMNVDVLPTLCRAAGADADGPAPLDGVDAFDVLTGTKASLPARDLYFFTGQSGPEKEQLAVINADEWKLVIIGPDIRRAGGYATPAHRVELFRLKDDPGEKTDLAAKRPDLVEQLGRKLVAFRKTEPDGALAPPNRPPRDFKPPPAWRNAPAGARPSK